MASRINPAPLMSLIICVILTLVFTVLVVTTSSDIRRLREGDPDRPSYLTIDKLTADVREKQVAIQNTQKTIALQKEELYRLDLQGNIRRLYYDDGQLMGAVATPENDQGMILDRNVKFKESSWALLRDLLQDDVKYFDGLRALDEGPERQTFPSLEEAIKRRQEQLRAVLNTIKDQDAAYTADRDRLAAKHAELEAQRKKIEDKKREDESLRLSRINELEDKIRALLELDLKWMVDRDKSGKVIGLAGLEPEGRVLQIDVQSGKVVIDKGARDRIVPGLIFEIFNYDRGAYINKGHVEVIEVQQGIAVCRVLGQSDAKHNPISRQDFIGNPVFSSTRPRVFVVAGEFKHYNKEDLESFIRHTGGIVWPQLAPGADYLVAGDRSDAAQAAARQYQILAMHEEDLLQYVQTTFVPLGPSTATGPVAPPSDPGALVPPPPAH